MKNCECTENTGSEGCNAAALWLVGIGSRKTDRQLSCGRHLNRTCEAMIQAEMPRRAVLTIAPVRPAEGA